ncbi:MAG TPA: PEPxxWA-CTERM sorting domain-containing protein, partial [Caulobacteraceae bacterium]|nr:PEPxxWA-CTERM sorting domain-containing protein [Caulobacteraceae bacterium]
LSFGRRTRVSGSGRRSEAQLHWNCVAWFVVVELGPYDASAGVTFTLSSMSSVVVPEPATWAMMLLGFAGLGLAIRSRRSASLWN